MAGPPWSKNNTCGQLRKELASQMQFYSMKGSDTKRSIIF